VKYTAEEIHRMRGLCRSLWYLDQHGSYRDSDCDVAAEACLVTYMSNETTAEELEVEVERRSRERFRRDEENARRYREAMQKGPQKSWG
jgi:hypothetical protein